MPAPPVYGPQSVRVHLRRDAGRVGSATGPWIRARQVAKVNGPARPDSVVAVVDRRGDTVGWGLYSPASSIAVRIICWTPEPPQTDWLAARIERAALGRDRIQLHSDATTGYRVVNSEGDGLGGLVIDRYADDLVVQLTTAPMLARRDEIVGAVRRHVDVARVHVIVPDSAAKHEAIPAGVELQGTPAQLTFSEAGIHFAVDPPPSQKTGAYFDQRDNRRWVAAAAAQIGLPLLDVGCHVGGFALHARRQGVPATGVDSSKRALARAAANAAAAGWPDLTWVEQDMFGRLDDPALQGPFGVVVFDPPKLTVRKSDVDRALGAMTRSLGRLMPRVVEGGLLVVCTCSHHLTGTHLDRAICDASHSTAWTRVKVLGPDLDHPVAPGHREGEYLTVAVYQRRV